MVFSFVLMIFLYGLFGIPGYVLTGISLYSIANRRGLERPWMAWVPGMNVYLLGCISDQYQAIVRGKNKNKRIAILLLLLVQMVAFCEEEARRQGKTVLKQGLQALARHYGLG